MNTPLQPLRLSRLPWLVLLLALALPSAAPAATSVTIAGSLQSELGCPGDWQPDCASTFLVYDAGDGVWQGAWTIPGGSYEYKAALDGSWAENYGQNAQLNGANLPLALGGATTVKFYYDDTSHWITSNQNSVIATVPGSFQSELGCPGDWQPDCLRSWLQDPDGDGVYSFRTSAIPPGNYEAKVAINESWDENYGLGGVPGGPNIPFAVPVGSTGVEFIYNPVSHVLTIDVESPPPAGVTSVTIAGSLQSELGCPGDWDPACAATHLTYDAGDDVWQGTRAVPPGSFEYKAALNDSWTENYGANAQLNGANIPLSLPGPADVKFYYDHDTHWVTDGVNSVIATVPGSFQSELGCPGDWDPGCLRSWLQDPDGDGLYSFVTDQIPAGDYEAKVAIRESWDENYGEGGVQNGPNIPFSVPSGALVRFTYSHLTHVLTISIEGGTPTRKVTWGQVKTLYR